MVAIGTIFNHKYQMCQQLGEGGTSIVYQALDLDSGQTVVIKLMKENLTSSYMDDLIRFKREVEIISGLNYPQIIEIFGAGEFENRPYIVMEFLAGKSLADRLDHGAKFPLETTVRNIIQLAETLSYVHGYGIIHRDLKPGNIYWPVEETGTGVKLLDFGISHIIELGAIKDRDQVIGTFGYMSPEATGMLNRAIDERSDLYSLGVVFYQLVTGQLPFQGKDVQQILHQQVALVPVSPVKLNPEIPELLDAIIMKLLQKDPDQRYQSATGLLFDLKRYFHGEMKFILGENEQPRKLSLQPTQLFGRHHEMDKIQRWLEQAGNGTGIIGLITGEAGIGKSRLIEEIRTKVYEQKGLFIKGRCLNHENKTPYQPFRDAIDEYLNWLEKTDSGKKQQEINRLRNSSGDLGQILIQFNPRLEKLMDKVKPLVTLEPDRENQRFQMVLSSFFCNLTEKGEACVLFLDDLQWADEGTLNLLEEIKAKINGSSLLILGTCRDTEPGAEKVLARLESKTQPVPFNFEKLQLAPLDYEQLHDLITHITGRREKAPPELVRYLLEKSKGNPFFAINILRELLENQVLSWQENQLTINWETLRRLSIPDTIVDILLRRIDNLTWPQVDILCKAAVIGREFNIELLFKLASFQEAEIVKMVDDFIAMQLLNKGTERGRVVFAHDRIRDAFSQRLNAAEKRQVHQKIAQTIEELSGSHLDENLFELAHHYIAAEIQPKALQYALPAANKAKASYANEEAVWYYQKAIELLEGDTQKGGLLWMKANEDLAEVYLIIGKNDNAICIAKNLLPLVTEPMSRARIFKKMGIAYFKKGEWSKSEEHFRKGLAFLDYKIPKRRIGVLVSLFSQVLIRLFHELFPKLYRHPDGKPVHEAESEVVSTCIYLTWMYGFSDAQKFLNTTIRMLNLSETRLGESKESGFFLCAYGMLFTMLAFFKTSIQIQKKALMMRQKLGDKWGVAQSLAFLGYAYCVKGDYQNGISYVEQAYEQFGMIGDLWEQGMVAQQLGIIYFRISDYPKASKCFFQYLEISQRINDAFGLCGVKLSLVNLYTESGDLDQAEAISETAMQLCASNENAYQDCITNLHRGYLELEKGNYDQAIAYLEKSKAILEKNTFFRDMLVSVYSLLANAYLKKTSGQPDINFSKLRRLTGAALHQTRPWPNFHGGALRVAADYYAFLGKNNQAEKYYLRSIEHHQKIGRRFETAKGYFEYGHFLEALHRPKEAQYNWSRANEIFKEIGAAVYIKRCEAMDLQGSKETAPDIPTTTDRLTSERSLNAVITTGRYLSSILDIHIVLKKIIDSAMELVGAERGILLLYPETGARELEAVVTRNITKEETSQITSNISSGIIAKVEQEKKPFIVADALEDEALKNRFSVIASRIRSVICTPIITRGEMQGIIYLDNSLVSGLFHEEDLKVLDLIACQAGVSIENARLYQSQEERIQERTEQLEAANQELHQKNRTLQTVNEQLKEHAATVAELAVTKERNRVARDVHDTIGHTMTQLLRLLEVSQAICPPEPPEVKIKLAHAIDITQEGLKEVRRSLSGLMPERLEADNLIEALERLFAGFQTSGVRIDFTVDGAVNLPGRAYHDAIYRTCQEALTNALRHGKAKNVGIIFKFNPDKIKLYIVDDGCGCKKIKKGVGLSGMEQRINELHGTCQYTSDGESGFNILVEIPFPAGGSA